MCARSVITSSMYVSIYLSMYVPMDGWVNGWMDGWMDRPTPFFVMDEVDAAFDNVNVRKICNYIKYVCMYLWMDGWIMLYSSCL